MTVAQPAVAVPHEARMRERTKRIVVIMPAYNAEKTLRATYSDLPMEVIDDVILVDDCSSDNTVQVARELGLRVFVHERNKGYGGNQKTCYREALKLGADIVVMVHPDHQYDPKVIPQLVQPLLDDECDACFGSRMLGKRFREGGMPWWKIWGNILLTTFENLVLGTYLTEYHSGFRAYSRRYLEVVPFGRNSDDFVFDTEIIAQGVLLGLRVQEIPIATRYFDDASQVSFWRSVRYGLAILATMAKVVLHKRGLIRFRLFEDVVESAGNVAGEAAAS